MTDLYRDKRDRPSLCVTCAGQNDRDSRDTPLGGVTTVTLTKMVPIPPFLSGAVTVDGALSKKIREGC